MVSNIPTQPDTSPKRYLYLEQNIMLDNSYTKQFVHFPMSSILHATLIDYLDFWKKVTETIRLYRTSFWNIKSTFLWIIYTCTLYFEFHMHVISYPLLGLCIISIFEAIKYQYKDAHRFPVLTVLWLNGALVKT